MHWCPDETAAVLTLMGANTAMGLWLRAAWYRARAWLRSRKKNVAQEPS